jgi:hypothetical protein
VVGEWVDGAMFNLNQAMTSPDDERHGGCCTHRELDGVASESPCPARPTTYSHTHTLTLDTTTTTPRHHFDAGDADTLRSVAPDVLRAHQGPARGYLLIHAAAEGGHAQCITVLADCGAGVTFCAVTDDGRTPASLAAEKGHAECLEELAEQGAAATFCTAMTEPGLWTVRADGLDDALTPAHRVLSGTQSGWLCVLVCLGLCMLVGVCELMCVCVCVCLCASNCTDT